MSKLYTYSVFHENVPTQKSLITRAVEIGAVGRFGQTSMTSDAFCSLTSGRATNVRPGVCVESRFKLYAQGDTNLLFTGPLCARWLLRSGCLRNDECCCRLDPFG